MIDAERLAAPIKPIFLVDGGEPVHREIEFEWYAEWINHPQRASLKRLLDPAVQQAARIEVVLCLVEIFFAIDLEAEDARDRLIAALQNDAMMAALFHRAQINSVRRFMSDLKAEGISPEGARCSEVRDHERDMIEPDDVKRRVQNRRRNGHSTVSTLHGVACLSLTRPIFRGRTPFRWNSVGEHLDLYLAFARLPSRSCLPHEVAR